MDTFKCWVEETKEDFIGKGQGNFLSSASVLHLASVTQHDVSIKTQQTRHLKYLLSIGYSLEGLMLKFQYFGYLMQRADSLEKTPDAGKDWGQEEKGATEDEMAGWHHRLNGHGFEQTSGDGEGQGSLHATVHEAAKSWTRLSNGMMAAYWI